MLLLKDEKPSDDIDPITDEEVEELLQLGMGSRRYVMWGKNARRVSNPAFHFLELCQV
jgi:hypothetical protein